VSITLGAGHRAVVVGAGGTIGAAICQGYAAAGAAVLALDANEAAARSVVTALPGQAHKAAALDVTDLEAVSAAAVAAGADGVSSVCYAAGVAPTFDMLSFDRDRYRQTMGVNLDGALHVAHAFGTVMTAAARGGSFCFLSSAAGRRGESGAAAYCASKFALLGVTESFAAEAGPHGIRVNAVCPGNVASPMLTRVARAQAARHGTSADAELEAAAGAAALRRLVRPEEVADVVVWLASGHASAVTGATIDVTAGLWLT
jgi:NAD(P)-dependent dehydrogenase (short-subunit alcohol dehydrogenase family)